MKPTRTRRAGADRLSLSASSVRADVRADEKTRVEFAGMLGRMFNIFGGKAAREGVTSTVAVKGDRKATLNDTTGQIIDLDEEKIYDLDLKKKTYKVTTFAELRRQMEEARKKAEEDARKEQQQEEKAKPAERDPNQKEVEVDFDVKNTGQKKAINGFDTHQVVMTITVREKGKTLEQSGGLVMTSDMWLAPKIAAMKEIADFDMRYAQTAVRADGRRRLGRADGDGDGDVSDDEGRDGADERRRREARRHGDPDDGDDGRGEVGRTDRAGSESGPSGQPADRRRHQRPARRHAREEDRAEE